MLSKPIHITRQSNLRRLVLGYDTQEEAAQAFNMSPQAVSHYMTGTKPMGEKVAAKIEDAAKKPPGWLSAKSLDTIESGNVTAGPDIENAVPCIGWVQAGEWADCVDAYVPGVADDYVLCTAKHSERSYALRVQGDSMWNSHGRPSYHDGDLIVCDPEQAGGVTTGDRVIALLHDDSLPMSRRVTFKVIVFDGPHVYLRPLNASYPTLTDSFDVIAKVIQAIHD